MTEWLLHASPWILLAATFAYLLFWWDDPAIRRLKGDDEPPQEGR